MQRMLSIGLSVSLSILLCSHVAAAPPEVDSAIARIRAVEAEGKGNREATTAWKSLSALDAEQIPALLAGMDGAGPLAENWLRAAIDSIAERTIKAKGKLPTSELENFLRDQKHSPRARRLAFEWIAKVDPTANGRLIPTFLGDSSLELRREAVASHLSALEKPGSSPDPIVGYQQALHAARDLDQVEAIAKKLVALKSEPKLEQKLGFVLKWKVAAPFDNVKRLGFNTAFPPEKAVDLQAKYAGKEGAEVSWVELSAPATPNETSPGKVGIVDFKAKYGNLKGALAYAWCEVECEKAQPAEFRLGSYNANKLWLNGELLMANDVYHGGMEVDQYIARGHLKAGKNTILLKIAQNEQTESWTHVWSFQLRVCDAIGTPIMLK